MANGPAQRRGQGEGTGQEGGKGERQRYVHNVDTYLVERTEKKQSF